MLLQLGLPSFDTVLHNARIRFVNNLHLLDNSDNSVLAVSCRLWHDCLHSVFLYMCFHVFFFVLFFLFSFSSLCFSVYSFYSMDLRGLI